MEMCPFKNFSLFFSGGFITSVRLWQLVVRADRFVLDAVAGRGLRSAMRRWRPCASGASLRRRLSEALPARKRLWRRKGGLKGW